MGCGARRPSVGVDCFVLEMPAPDRASDPRQEEHADAPSGLQSRSQNAARAIVVVAFLNIVFMVSKNMVVKARESLAAWYYVVIKNKRGFIQ